MHGNINASIWVARGALAINLMNVAVAILLKDLDVFLVSLGAVGLAVLYMFAVYEIKAWRDHSEEILRRALQDLTQRGK